MRTSKDNTTLEQPKYLKIPDADTSSDEDPSRIKNMSNDERMMWFMERMSKKNKDKIPEANHIKSQLFHTLLIFGIGDEGSEMLWHVRPRILNGVYEI